MNRRARLGVTGLPAALLVAAVLSGCGTGDSGLRRDAARQLQARVLEVTQASSQNDPATALKALEGLEAELETAQAKGDVSEERRRSITTIATAVRADLNEAAAAAEQARAQAAEEARKAAEAASPSAAATQEAATTPAPPAEQPSGQQGQDQEKKGNQGKGKGSD